RRRPRRVHVEPLLEPGLPHLLAKHCLRERRAADVTQTHEQHSRLASTHSRPFPSFPGATFLASDTPAPRSCSRGAARGSHRGAEFLLTRSRGERGVDAGPGGVPRKPERSSPRSTFVLNVVSAGGIPAHPAGEPAGRGRHHPANVDSPGANNHITGSLKTPRSLRSAKNAEGTNLRALRGSA